MLEKAQIALVFLAITVAQTGFFLAAVATIAHSLRLAVESYVFGFGPVVARKGRFCLRLVPLAAYFVPVHRTQSTPVSADLAKALERGERRLFDELPGVLSLGLVLLPSVVPFLGASVLLGPGRAVQAVRQALGSYVLGALAPLSHGQTSLAAALHVYGEGGNVRFSAGSFAVLTAMNILAWPSSAMFLLGLSSQTFFWPRLRFLYWVLQRLSEVSWLVSLVLWITVP